MKIFREAFVVAFLMALVVGVVAVTNGAVMGQDNHCPDPPNGLNSVANLEWLELDQMVRLTVGNNNRNRYLQTWLIWDTLSGDVQVEGLSGTVEALQLAARLGIQEHFIDDIDRTYLTLSPMLQHGVYIRETSTSPILYSVDVNSSGEPVEEGRLAENMTDVDMFWYSDTELVAVVEPMYGPGYQIYQVCLGGNCFINISEIIDTFAGMPGINIEQRSLAIYDSSHSRIVLYELDGQTIQSEIPIRVQLLPNLPPVWSPDGGYLYLLGFDQEFGASLVVYQLNIGTGELILVTELYSDSPTVVTEWLISPQGHYVIISTPHIEVRCF